MSHLRPPLVCVIDVEASGFGRHSYPIEVGCVLPDGRAWCTLIRPPARWTHWDPSAEQVHGISRELLLQHGRAAAEVAQTLNTELAGQTVYCDAWAHDYPWLAVLFDEAGCNPHFKLEPVTVLLDDLGLARLPQAQQRALQALGLRRHRASNDARALQTALGEILQPTGTQA